MDPPCVRAVITGASSGIGRQIAIELARRFQAESPLSPRLVVHFRNNRRGAEETARLVEAIGATPAVVQADLCDADDRLRLVENAWDFLGKPTTWVNNAGADVLTGDAKDLPFEQKLRLLVDTDLLATIALSRLVVSRLHRDLADADPVADADAARSSRQGPPSVTFVGWDQAPKGMEGDAGQLFGPAKAAVMAYANSLAQEVAPQIRVNTIAPGWIKTAWGETTDAYWDERAKSQSLMQRWGTPADVAQAVGFVVDPANTFCCGQTICVNGGWNRRFPHRSPDRP